MNKNNSINSINSINSKSNSINSKNNNSINSKSNSSNSSNSINSINSKSNSSNSINSKSNSSNSINSNNSKLSNKSNTSNIDIEKLSRNVSNQSIQSKLANIIPIQSNLVSNILIKITDDSNKQLRMYIMIAIPIIGILCFLLYKYNFSSRATSVIAKMGYATDLNLTPIPQCYQVDLKYQYKLCDYYINSSFMTPCVGNQHYDYVSNDMIKEVIQSGARYIQIPICESDVGENALPVVATAVYGQRVITSLNNLEIKSVLKIIRATAFKINNKQINYPLIIHLILNTNNAFTLGVLADNIQEILSDVLIVVSKYINIPIFLEKLCNLLGKIIIIATPEYIGSKLEPYIVPTNKLFEIYHFSEIEPINMPNDTVYKNLYNQKLSSKAQTQSNKLFKSKYKTIEYIVDNADTIGAEILNDKNILNNITCFNKVGMTIVKPLYPEDVISNNYNTDEAIYYGCQIPAMNFQTNDINLQNYLLIFKESSFRLKPDSLRFTEKEEPIADLLSVYDSSIQKKNTNINILNDAFSKFNNILITIESYNIPKIYLTQIENNLKFNLGSNQSKTNTNNIQYKIDINQCFIPRQSKIGTKDNISMYLESAAMPGLYITLNSNTFILQELSSNKKDLLMQAFYIEKPKTVDVEHNGSGGNAEIPASIRTTDNDKPLYISCENKQVKAYPDSPQVQAHNNMSVYINPVAFKMIINIITLFDGSFKTMGSNILGILENNINDGTSYYVNSTNQNGVGNNFDIFKNQFTLQNTNTNTYITFDNANGFLYDKELQLTPNCIFSIKPINGYYSIVNSSGQNIVLYDKNLIRFAPVESVSTNENLFKLNISYELL